MEYGIQALAGIGMVFAVITDLWQKKIAVYVIFTITIVLLFMQFCSGNGFIWICSLGSGSIFYMISLLTKEKIGKGDAFLFGMTGAAMGLWKNEEITELLCRLAFVIPMIKFVVALYLIILRKKNKETAFPFAPCIGLAYFLVLAAG